MVRQFPDPQKSASGQFGLSAAGYVVSVTQFYKLEAAYVFKSSGSCCSGFLVGHGNMTKLILVGGMTGALFIKRYSSSHIGMTSSSAETSRCVEETNPRYTVVHLEESSSVIRTVVAVGRNSVGASFEEGGFRGEESNICSGDLGIIGPGVKS